ncbi:hypothetical protein [Brevundimonas albigilva]|uniref:Uncharacterized protein n=1 Tax=Brevundimonas albigilva TaxID=1312364 RepID=A0ABY4SQ15_9CAUL|nr:hypothetical protein [Brevundimonas albigilva]URI15921.1 hypothetical protein M8231_02715 [Brevundimonas albigilva]
MTVHLRFQDTLHLRVPEWIAAAMMADWGRKLLAHDDIFARQSSFAGMAAIMPQWAWGVWALILGGLGLIALAINGFWVATPFLRMAASFGRLFLWLQIQFGLLAAGLPTTGTSIYIGIAALELWNLYRAGGDARRAVS